MKQKLVVIAGPTGVGKSHIAVELAKRVNGAVISADSMQVYKGMDIGSAKMTQEEMQGIEHALIDVLEPTDAFHVVRFQEMAKEALADFYAKGKLPIIAGGTGFYIQAVTRDIDFTEHEELPEYRKELSALSDEELYARVLACDPDTDIHPKNRKRLIRALEFAKQTGEPISEHNRKERERKSPYDLHYYVLTKNRADLYAGIEERVDQMMEAGLLSEVRQLREAGCTSALVSMQGLGYKELLDYLDGNCTLEEAVERIKRDTRHFAKRQLTWFKREAGAIWFDRDRMSESEIIEAMLCDLDTCSQTENTYE